MNRVKRLKGMQELIFGEFKEPDFIPSSERIRFERARTFAGHKLLQGWDPKDVIEYLEYNGFSEEKARKIVVPLYNRVTTPFRELKRGYR